MKINCKICGRKEVKVEMNQFQPTENICEECKKLEEDRNFKKEKGMSEISKLIMKAYAYFGTKSEQGLQYQNIFSRLPVRYAEGIPRGIEELIKIGYLTQSNSNFFLLTKKGSDYLVMCQSQIQENDRQPASINQSGGITAHTVYIGNQNNSSSENQKKKWFQTIKGILPVAALVVAVLGGGGLIGIKQFELLHHARIELGYVEGDVRGGVIPFVNTGGLPAKHVFMMWKIISIEGGNVKKMFPSSIDESLLSKKGMELSNYEDVEPDVIKKVNYYSELDLHEKQVFLVVVWAYDGKGINRYTINDVHFLWNVYSQPVAWVSSSIISSGEMKAINKTKDELKKVLEKIINKKNKYRIR